MTRSEQAGAARDITPPPPVSSAHTHFINHHTAEEENEDGHGRGQRVQQGGVAGAAALTSCRSREKR